jgi:hypothetical protein
MKHRTEETGEETRGEGRGTSKALFRLVGLRVHADLHCGIVLWSSIAE